MRESRKENRDRFLSCKNVYIIRVWRADAVDKNGNNENERIETDNSRDNGRANDVGRSGFRRRYQAGGSL